VNALAKRPQRPWLTYALGVALAAAIVVAYTSVGQASPSTAQTRRTATVAEGVVQSTVSGSGTLQPASKVGVNFASSGTLTGVFVKVGEHVKKGELLAEVDPSSAESALRSAELSLSTDEADYHDAVAGLTPAEAHQAEITADQSRASVDSAKQTLKQDQHTAKSELSSANATVAQDEVSLRSTEQAVAVEAKSQQDAVNQDISQRATDEKAVVEARAELEKARAVGSAESKVASAEASLRSAEAKVTQDAYLILTAQNAQAAGAVKGQQSIDGARNAVANAKKARESTQLRGEQTIAQARTSLHSQELALQATLASNEVKAAPPKAATVVSAENTVKSAQMTVEKARQTLTETKLYAPAEGVVASVKSSVGESVSGSGSEASSSAIAGTGASGGSGSGTGAGTAGTGSSGAAGTAGTGSSGAAGGASTGTSGAATNGASGGGVATSAYTGDGSFHNLVDTSSTTGGNVDIATASGAGAAGAGSTSTSSSATSGESSSTSGAFIELVDLSGYQVVVPLSEAEIVNVHVGQIATVAVEALEGRKFAALLASLAVLSTSSSGAVSYDVTFQLEQTATGMKPGMSATAEIVVKQAEGINVPTSAITAGRVTVERGGKQVTQAVTTGLAGNTNTIILSGLKAGETVLLPAASTSGSSGASLTSRLAGRAGGLGGLGGGGLGGGGFGGGGGGGGGGFAGRGG
jgi:macrolide-specific efflux system membrane fusion protein